MFVAEKHHNKPNPINVMILMCMTKNVSIYCNILFTVDTDIFCHAGYYSNMQVMHVTPVR